MRSPSLESWDWPSKASPRFASPLPVVRMVLIRNVQIGTPNFVERLVAQKRLKANLFAFYLSRGKLAGSQLSIGAVNAKHYTGSITYTPVTSADHVSSPPSFQRPS